MIRPLPTLRRPRAWVGGIKEKGRVVKKARSLLLTLLLGAVTIRVLWWAVSPLVPYLVSATAIVLVLGFIYYRMTRW